MSLDWKDKAGGRLGPCAGKHSTSRDKEGNNNEILTCRYGPIEEHRVGDQDQQHWGVGGDVVWDGVLEALLTAAPEMERHIEIRAAEHGSGSRGAGP